MCILTETYLSSVFFSVTTSLSTTCCSDIPSSVPGDRVTDAWPEQYQCQAEDLVDRANPTPNYASYQEDKIDDKIASAERQGKVTFSTHHSQIRANLRITSRPAPLQSARKTLYHLIASPLRLNLRRKMKRCWIILKTPMTT